ncbi:DUF2141 domain-containing protein [Spongiimicrobium salis]|uniref:DUF2141 domain-containing protein n=1 Tax=Spongiimicrobium salis TaxID=1667022 RepID=UPI00374D9957
MKRFCVLFLLLPCFALAQNTLSVNVSGVKTSDGKISVAVYDTSEGFLKFDQVFKGTSASAQKGITNVVIDDLPDGEYALAVFHDKNANDELDTNWLGIPKEAIGFSKAKMKTFGPPRFKECAMKIDADAEITIKIK